MLRSLASYFFGGSNDPSLQSSAHCHTREVNDWLLVDMGDQAEEDAEVVDVSVSALEEAMDESEDDPAAPPNPDWTEDQATEWPQLVASGFYESSLDSSQLRLDDLFASYNELRNVASLEPSDNGDLEEALLEFRAVCESLIAMRDLEEMARRAEDSHVEVEHSTPKRRAVQRPRGAQKERRPPCNLTCHPLYSNNYVNHRHPSSPPKADLQERVRELEVEQKARIYALAKNTTRSNLNRSNKNCIYQSSAKTNRRKNLQRNHSGANNNRKC